MSAVLPVLEPGHELAPGYEVLAHVSRSRALDVYDVWSAERACRCIAKTPRPDRREDRDVLRRLAAEGALLLRLSHPHVVRGYEAPTAEHPVVVMETLAGETLAHLIETGEPLTPAELAHLGLHLCSAVSYLHRQGVLHLDLKPSNVIAECGRAKIIDLSVARRPGLAPPCVGTWCYMAPEQVWGGELTPAADVWGIGLALWEAATGRPAFGGDEDVDAATGTGDQLPPEEHPQVRRAAEPVSRFRTLPEALAGAIEAALSEEPGGRPSVHELADLLERVPDVTSPRAAQRSTSGSARGSSGP
jgi:serine/threonine protein kinase